MALFRIFCTLMLDMSGLLRMFYGLAFVVFVGFFFFKLFKFRKR